MTKPRRRPKRYINTPTERQVHRAIADWLRVMRPDCLWFHVPNGGWRDAGTAGLMKGLGVKKGIPDLAFVLPGGRAGFMEVKRPCEGRLSPDQKAMFTVIRETGGLVEVVESIDDVQRVLKLWGVPLYRRAPEMDLPSPT